MVPVLVLRLGWRATNPPSSSFRQPYTEMPCVHAARYTRRSPARYVGILYEMETATSEPALMISRWSRSNSGRCPAGIASM